ncbi:MAG: phosphate signaling complex protein PhoU [Candidatus Caenarcaniphilales bacterium]|nr:phosphate signaling complex protein PhoU [Candidatus Caenarcaniphilales bacterium]
MDSNNPYLTTRVTLTRELNRLRQNVFVIGEDCCQALAFTVSSFTVSSQVIENKVNEIYTKVNQFSDSLENDCLTILSLQQPLLRDLRLVVGVLRISNYLTRIADYSARLVRLSGLIEDKSLVPSELVTISENCQIMLSDVLKAFNSGSISLALELVRKDEDINLLHDTSFQKLIRRMNKESADLVQLDANLLTCARYLERIGDVIAAIAKEVYFIYSGKKYTDKSA